MPNPDLPSQDDAKNQSGAAGPSLSPGSSTPPAPPGASVGATRADAALGAVKRDLPQIRFPQWWKDGGFRQRLVENRIPLEEQKAAVWYEAARRRPEVQKARLEGKFLLGDNGWQYFTGWVVQNAPRAWPELDEITRRSLIELSYSPWSVPPAGLSTFPTDKAEQKEASMQELHLPRPGDGPDAAQRFVEHARRFADNGFVIVAVDKKQNQAVRAACEAIEELPPTFRKADIKPVVVYNLPPDISDADKKAVEEKQNQGTLTKQDMDELWRQYNTRPTNQIAGPDVAGWVARPRAANSLDEPWLQVAEGRDRVLHKRPRQGKLIEEKQFNFESICRQFEAFDNGCVSDFVNSIRL